MVFGKLTGRARRKTGFATDCSIAETLSKKDILVKMFQQRNSKKVKVQVEAKIERRSGGRLRLRLRLREDM